jgi:hypothetical protein
MNVRRRILAGPLLAAALLPVTAHADPFVGRVGTTSTEVKLRGTDGKAYTVSLGVTVVTPQNGAATYSLTIGITKCADGACGAGKRYVTTLTASQVKADAELNSVDVTATLMGAPFRVVWTASEPASPTQPHAHVGGPIDFTLNGDGQPASVRATLWGATCRADGEVSNTYAVEPDGYAAQSGSAPPKTVPAQFAQRGSRRPSCLI